MRYALVHSVHCPDDWSKEQVLKFLAEASFTAADCVVIPVMDDDNIIPDKDTTPRATDLALRTATIFCDRWSVPVTPLMRNALAALLDTIAVCVLAGATEGWVKGRLFGWLAGGSDRGVEFVPDDKNKAFRGDGVAFLYIQERTR